jgi:hypothetical protein
MEDVVPLCPLCLSLTDEPKLPCAVCNATLPPAVQDWFHKAWFDGTVERLTHERVGETLRAMRAGALADAGDVQDFRSARKADVSRARLGAEASEDGLPLQPHPTLTKTIGARLSREAYRATTGGVIGATKVRLRRRALSKTRTS